MVIIIETCKLQQKVTFLQTNKQISVFFVVGPLRGGGGLRAGGTSKQKNTFLSEEQMDEKKYYHQNITN